MRVAIVGAGIAGLNCALHLLRAGHDVTVMEKLRGPIDRVCGEGILPFGVALLRELGLDDAVRHAGRPFLGLEYRHGDRRAGADFESGSTGIGIERGALDRILRQVCGDYAAFELIEGCRFRDPLVQGDEARREAGSGESEFDRIVCADGIHAPIAVARGHKRRFSRRLGVRFRLDAPPPERVVVHFFRFGEIYLTPTGDQGLSVAMLLRPDRVPVKGGELESWCATTFAASLPKYAAYPIGAYRARAPIAARWRTMPRDLHLLGDALQAFDPISGAGMSFALLCGKFAAQHLEDVNAYNRAIKPAIASVGGVTQLILRLSGGGLGTKLMLRQLNRAPAAFARILALHDGRHKLNDLGWRHVAALLRV